MFSNIGITIKSLGENYLVIPFLFIFNLYVEIRIEGKDTSWENNSGKLYVLGKLLGGII
jgi:hypothetical protein